MASTALRVGSTFALILGTTTALVAAAGGAGDAGDTGDAWGFANVAHLPLQPRTGDEVVVTARPSAANPRTRITLEVQVVEPGRYVRRTDPEFAEGWRSFPMSDQGEAGDAHAGDGIFTAVIPGVVQVHRRLVRYRLLATTTQDEGTIRWPTSTDTCPNAAWFVYDGVPEWQGASRPGSALLTFSPAFLATLPTYHLIARSEDVEASQWHPRYNRQPFLGTLVYEGKVYDHIRYHNRGQASTYVAGKNKWGFKFLPGHEFEARDLWNRPYAAGWPGFNLNACASPWAQVNRGMAGLDEAVSYRAYQLAGVPSPDTWWVHFRVVDEESETPRNDPYGGDLWGLYLVIQEKDGNWLRHRGLPEGNIYSAESGPKHLVEQGRGDGMDLDQFTAGTRRRNSETWWRRNLDVDAYYTFHALNRVLGNIDLRPDGNHYMYHRPDGRWVALPHDLDMMFIPKTHWPGTIHATRCLSVPALQLEYANRAREILDLFCSDPGPSGGQVGQLVEELAGVLAPAGHSRNWAELDEAMWNHHPRSNHPGQFNIETYPDQRMGGAWTRRLASPDFAGFRKYIVDFCTDSRPRKNYRPNDGDQRGYGFGFLQYESLDEQVPRRPMIRPRDVNAGRNGGSRLAPAFEASPFVSPALQGFGSIQWRVAEISAPGLPGYVKGRPWRYEIEEAWTIESTRAAGVRLRVPSDVCEPGKTYRVRARYRDQAGRYGHWSEPITLSP